MFDKEQLGKERAFATEVAKIFEWSRPKVQTPEILFKKALALRRVVAEEQWRGLAVAQEIRRLNIDQLKSLCRIGMDVWERERMRARGWDIDPLHLLKAALREAVRQEADKVVFEKIVQEVV